MEVGTTGTAFGGGAEVDAEFVRHLETEGEVATLDQRWTNSWTTSLRTRCALSYIFFRYFLCLFHFCPNISDLKPLRIPLHSKKSKRCPHCRHILIKPEQKAQSVRYKIKLVAANYLPAITVSLPHAKAALEMMKRSSALGKSSSGVEKEADTNGGSMLAGKTYPFHLSFTNPLYDPIQVRVHVQRTAPPAVGSSQAAEQGQAEKAPARRPPFAVTLPSGPIPVAAFAEAWEYEDDEDMFGLDDEDFDGRRDQGRAKARTVGVLERRANVTVIGGEVVIAKEAKGNIKVKK